MIKIFVLHYSKLFDRKQYILYQFEKYNITNFEFIEKYDKDEITEEESNIFHSQFKKSSMSLSLKHFYVYKEIADKYDNALILEDDAILCDNFLEKLNLYISKIPINYDMLFIGDGCNLHIEKHNLITGKYIYPKCLYPTEWGGNGATRCTDSYIISKKCANKLNEYIQNIKNKNNSNNNSNNSKINLPIDWWLNNAARDNNLIVYWAEPTIVTQGSENGKFICSC